ncbi:MAG: DUF4838 domain-containing protein [Bacteroidetes bacterium]|nr:DUF4838 domain-containing protein [Bacteroidota bacterium]
MLKNLFRFFVLALAAISCYGCQTNKLTLVKNGKTNYSIGIPKNASVEEVRAAEFLKEHLFIISGCDFPVIFADEPISENCILISKSDEITSADGFSIATRGSIITIKGGQNKGCIYGVSELLEQYLGVRYFSPQYVVIPETKDIILPFINVNDSSPNTYRNVHGDFANDKNYQDFHRLNLIADRFADGYYVHTFHRLIPWQDYFASNPEYFAFMNGKRIIDQLCLTNEDVYQLIVEKLGEEMLKQPEKQVWSVSQDDNFSYCQCEHCSKIIEMEGSAAGPIIHLVNRVAEQFPDKIISTLAYQYSRQAPLKTKPLENVQVMLCTIELNRSQPIADDPRSKSFLKDLEDWGKICNHIYLWDYTVDFAHSISPFPNLHTLQPNIQLFVNNHVKEHFQQSNTGVGHEFSELKSYLLAKLLWNPEVDVSSIIEDFTNGFYGAGGVWIRKYIEHMQSEILKSGEWLDIYGPPTNHQNTFLSLENTIAYNQYFDEAENAVKENPDHLLHVRTARMPLQYAMMEIGKADMFGQRGWYQELNGNFVLHQHMLEILESFYKTSIRCGSAPVNESGLTTEEYYHATKRFIDVQVEGNLAFRKKVSASILPAQKYSEGDLSYLTNGVRGANDFKVHWLGWEGQDFSLYLDMETEVNASTIEISTLWDPKSWILHPLSVTCMVSVDGINFVTVEKKLVDGNQKKEEVNKLFSFAAENIEFRYVKFDIKGTLKLFDWHPSAGGTSWVFADEIVVR